MGSIVQVIDEQLLEIYSDKLAMITSASKVHFVLLLLPKQIVGNRHMNTDPSVFFYEWAVCVFMLGIYSRSVLAYRP